MRAHPLVEQAHATLCRLADAPSATDAARAAIAEIERTWSQPFAAGIGGELPARTALINTVCGDKAFDPYARSLGGAAVRLRRGDHTGFRVLREDGSTEEHASPDDRAHELATARARIDAARAELGDRERALVRVQPRRPAAWAVWRWFGYWLAAWRERRRRDEGEGRALVDARARLATLDADAEALARDARLERTRYVEALRRLASSHGVLEVEITLAASALPEGVELVELAGASRAGAEVDAVFLAKDDQVYAPVRGGHPLALGDHAQLLAALPSLLADARALRIARRVEAKIRSVMAALADAIERKEATFPARIAKLEAMRVADPSAFATARLERVRGEISASVTAVLEHASVHLGAELAQLRQEWIGAVAAAADSEALKAAVAKIEEEWSARPRRLAEEVRVLVMGGLGGSVRDIYPNAVEALASHGLPDEHARLRAAPELPPVALLPSLTKNASKLEKPGWLAGLFRSFESQRTEIRERVHERIERVAEVARSELLDAEPRLHHAIGSALARSLEAAIAHQQTWLDGALDAERAAIERDREVLAPLRSVHDAVRAETSRLTEMLAQLERQQPAIAVAAAAAETASLSR